MLERGERADPLNHQLVDGAHLGPRARSTTLPHPHTYSTPPKGGATEKQRSLLGAKNEHSATAGIGTVNNRIGNQPHSRQNRHCWSAVVANTEAEKAADHRALVLSTLYSITQMVE